MTTPSNYAVGGADRGREVTETAPISQQDKRLPNRPQPGSRRRRRGSRGKPSPTPPASVGEDTDLEEPTVAKPSSNGKDHVVDTLA